MTSENKQESLTFKDRELFVSLYEEDRKRLYAYIFAIVANKAAADDIFQETSLTLWQEFSRFIPGTDFSKWANGIAYNRIRTYQRKDRKYSGFSEGMMELLVDSSDSEEKEDEKNWRILQECRTGLPDHSKKLYDDFYVKNCRAQEVADESGRSIFAIRKAIHKLRKKLFDCVDNKKEKRSE